MERAAIIDLINWKSNTSKKPLIVKGARQVGKTWLLQEFGKHHYKNTAYINFESSPHLRLLFSENFDIRRILLAIQIETGITVDPDDTLIILDEIQEATAGLTALKYFQENAPDYDLVAAGSLLGVALNNHQSFPVGKVDFLNLHPLDFLEFLTAVGEKKLADVIQSGDWTLVNAFAARYRELLKQYYYVGGMPEAVLSFATKKDFNAVRQIQKNILAAYENDFSKHAPTSIVPRIRMVWNSIPSQLARENRKFIFGKLRPGARASDYEEAISWLTDCGLVYKISNVTKSAIPLKAYEDLKAFKLFFADVGLLAAITDLDAKTLLSGNILFSEFKGALTEQFVLQQLVSTNDTGIYYWSPENTHSEIDFLLQISGSIVPLEVKADENLRAKSLRIFYDKYHPKLAVRTSMSEFRKEDWLINIPLFAISQLFKLTE